RAGCRRRAARGPHRPARAARRRPPTARGRRGARLRSGPRAAHRRPADRPAVGRPGHRLRLRGLARRVRCDVVPRPARRRHAAGRDLPARRAARRGELRDGARGVGGAGGAHGDRDDGGGAAARRARRRGVLMAGLEVRDVTVRYGGTTAVDGASLAVAPGEVVALLGPSGCGKSSLLRAVAGLEPLAGGRVAYDGADLAGVPVHRRRFGLMFQDGQLFPHRDVGRNVAYGLETQPLNRAERDARVAELLDLVGLAGYERRPVPTLSGGEQQRVALARALAPSPRLLLLDEPLSALDRQLRERLATEVRSVLVETGTTAVFVTHDHAEAAVVADRVAVM